MNNTRQIGNKAEDLACEYLKKQGFRILKRNFYIRGGEVDIIARDGEVLVFIEVKARYSHKFGLPIESITPWKLKTLQKSALFYIQDINWGNKPYRFDALTIDFLKELPEIELIKNILN